MVSDVEPIAQPIYAVMHHRHRTSRMQRRLTRIVAKEISGRGALRRSDPGATIFLRKSIFANEVLISQKSA